MRTKTGKVDFLGKLTAFSMALILLLSIFVPMYAGTVNADAASASYSGDIYIDLSVSNTWKDYAQTGDVTLGGQKLVAVDADKGIYKVTGNFTGDTLELAYYITIQNQANRLFCKGSYTHAYFWKEGGTPDLNGSFPGMSMTMFDTNMYYVDYNSKADSVIFNYGSDSGKTDDLTINKTNNVYNNGSWTVYNASDWTRKFATKTIKLSNRENNSANAIFMDSTSSRNLQWSKYPYENPFDDVATEEIYLKASSDWGDTAYVTYDVDDPAYSTGNANAVVASILKLPQGEDGETVEDATTTFIYKFVVPVGAGLRFQNSATNPTIITPRNGSAVYASGSSSNTYVQRDNGWDTLANARKSTKELANFYTSSDNFSTTTDLDGNKVVGVNATYYDYLSDSEMSGATWRNDTADANENGRHGKFNTYISTIATNNSSWQYPLYFGNMHNGPSRWGYKYNGTESLFNAANNSNYLNNFASKYTSNVDYFRSVQSLVDSTLNGSTLTVGNGVTAPYFDNKSLMGSSAGSGGDTKPTDNNIYLDVSGWTGWNDASAKTYAFFYGKGEKWVEMTKVSGKDYVYSCTKETSYPNIIFVRINPNSTDSDMWNRKWNQTGDLEDYQKQSNVYKVTNGNATCSGVWSSTNYDGSTPSSGTTADQYAQIVSSKFPFVEEDIVDGVKKYSFNSLGGKDNVYFTYDNNKPTAVNYGAGTKYAVKDGLYDYMSNTEASRYGIFPFNTAESTKYEYTVTGAKVYKIYIADSKTYDKISIADRIFSVEGARSGAVLQTPTYGKDAKNIIWRYYDNNDYRSSIDENGAATIYVVCTSDADWNISNRADVYAFSSTQGGNKEWQIKTDSGVNYSQKVSDNATLKYWGDDSSYDNAKNNYGKSCAENSLDYGFGVKMEFNFTVPENGLLSNGKYASFNYTGDDDLWVYIDGQLVLDLGGAHKMTSGSITFDGTNVKYNAADVYNGSTGASKSGTAISNFATGDRAEHTMTIFYMERGYLESNLQVEYTMTPVIPENELVVEKTVDINESAANPGLVDTITNLTNNESFNFSAQDNATDDTHFTTDGEASIKNGGSVTWTNKDTLNANDNITVTERVSSAYNFSYDTKVTGVYDSQDNLLAFTENAQNKTANFIFANAAGNDDVDTKVTVDYRNTIKYGDLKVEKNVTDKDGNDNNSGTYIDFNFNVALSFGSTPVSGATLYYKVYDADDNDVLNPLTGINNWTTDTDGNFTLKGGQYAVFTGIPVGATYEVNETLPAGYKLQSTGTTGTIGSTVQTASFTNIEQPVEAGLHIAKTVNGVAYSGNEFEFTCELVQVNTKNSGETAYEANQSLLNTHKSNYGTSGVSTKSQTDANGIIGFDTFTIAATSQNVGRYIFEIKEKGLNASAQQQHKYTLDSKTYYAVIEVSEGSVEDPKYFAVDSIDHFTALNLERQQEQITINNTEQTAEVSFTKTQADGTTALSGAQFKIYTDADCTQVLSDYVGADGSYVTTAYPTVTSTEEGTVSFTGLRYSAAETTTYYIKETAQPEGYLLLNGKITATISTSGTVTLSYDGSDVSMTDNKISNLPAGKDVEFTKTNESGTALKGAEFDIYKDADCTEKLTTNAYGDAITTVTSGEDGVVKFDKIPLGTYYIKETKAPNGYQLLTAPVKVEVTADGVTLSDNSLLSGSATDGYKLKNVKQPELPLAGGSGSTWLFVLGTVLVAVAGSALIFYKKRTQVFAFIKNKLNR